MGPDVTQMKNTIDRTLGVRQVDVESAAAVCRLAWYGDECGSHEVDLGSDTMLID